MWSSVYIHGIVHEDESGADEGGMLAKILAYYVFMRASLIEFGINMSQDPHALVLC